MSGGGVTLGVLVVVCACAGALLLVLARRAGHPIGPADPVAADALGDAAGVEDLTDGGVALLLFAAASCPLCRDTREVLTAVAGERAGVSHREIDVADRPDLVASLAVRTTPTVIVVDTTGAELLRVAGVPRRDDLVAALAPHLP